VLQCVLRCQLKWGSVCGSIRPDSDIPPTEEQIGLEIITTAEFSNKFSWESPYNQTRLHRSPQISIQIFPYIQTQFLGSHSKENPENWIIWRSKYFKSDLLHAWTCSVAYTRPPPCSECYVGVGASLPPVTHFKTLQYTVIHCTTLHHTASHCNTLHHTAPHCITLQHSASHYITLHHSAPHCITVQHSASHKN